MLISQTRNFIAEGSVDGRKLELGKITFKGKGIFEWSIRSFFSLSRRIQRA